MAMTDVALSVASSATSSGGGVSGGGFRWTEEQALGKKIYKIYENL